MRSFEKLSRGLPAEIRLLIWEYSTLSIIEVIETWPNNPAGLRALTEDHESISDDEDALIRLEFRPPLTSLVAIAQASHTTHLEFAAAIHKTGLSFDVTQVSAESICKLVAHFDQSSAPRIELLRISGPAYMEYLKSSRLLREFRWSLEPAQCTEGSHTSIPRVEISIQAQAWKTKADAIHSTYTCGSSSPYFWPNPDFEAASYARAAEPLGIDFWEAVQLVARNQFREVVFDTRPKCKDCSIVMGPTRLQERPGGEQNMSSTYRYQIVFYRTPGRAHSCRSIRASDSDSDDDFR